MWIIPAHGRSCVEKDCAPEIEGGCVDGNRVPVSDESDEKKTGAREREKWGVKSSKIIIAFQLGLCWASKDCKVRSCGGRPSGGIIKATNGPEVRNGGREVDPMTSPDRRAASPGGWRRCPRRRRRGRAGRRTGRQGRGNRMRPEGCVSIVKILPDSGRGLAGWTPPSPSSISQHKPISCISGPRSSVWPVAGWVVNLLILWAAFHLSKSMVMKYQKSPSSVTARPRLGPPKAAVTISYIIGYRLRVPLR